jgi:hypothetical protein
MDQIVTAKLRQSEVVVDLIEMEFSEKPPQHSGKCGRVGAGEQLEIGHVPE